MMQVPFQSLHQRLVPAQHLPQAQGPQALPPPMHQPLPMLEPPHQGHLPLPPVLSQQPLPHLHQLLLQPMQLHQLGLQPLGPHQQPWQLLDKLLRQVLQRWPLGLLWQLPLALPTHLTPSTPLVRLSNSFCSSQFQHNLELCCPDLLSAELARCRSTL